MEIKAINKKTTHFEHEVIIVINHKTMEYWVNSTLTECGKSWVQNYFKKRRGLSLTTSEQKQIKLYFENEFLKQIQKERSSALDLMVESAYRNGYTICCGKNIPEPNVISYMKTWEI